LWVRVVEAKRGSMGGTVEDVARRRGEEIFSIDGVKT